MTDAHTLQHAQEIRSSLAARLAAGPMGEADAELLQRASAMIEQLHELASTLDEQLAALRYLAQQRYRPRSEKVPEGQLALDLLGFLLQQSSGTPAGQDNEASPEPPLPDPPTKPPRKKRTSKLHLLPVEPVQRTLPEEQRMCSCCGSAKTAFGFEAKRHLVYEPARLYFQEEQLTKYACRTCEEGVVTACGMPKLIEGSNVSSSLLSHLVVSKVIDATPIERVGKQLSRHGADIAPSTLHDWYGRCGQEALLLQPVTRDELLRSGMISFDDSPLQAMRADGVGGTTRGRLWLYIGDIRKIAYCEFTPDWKGKHPQNVLAGYQGPIQSDGYGGALPLFRGPRAPTRVGCNDHARRKFVDALKQKDKRVEPVIALYGGLYAVEREGHSMTPTERLELRQQKSVLLWGRLQAEVARLSQHGERKSPLAKAVTYFERQQAALIAFLSDGHLPISNIHVERLLRMVALFRKNSLFVGSVDAGKRYAALLTLALNCILRDENPFAYFISLFDRLAAGWPMSRIAELLPQFRLGPDQALEQP